MALQPTRIIDVSALVAPPIVRPRHIPPASAQLRPLSPVLLGFRLGIVAPLAPIAEVEVEEGALRAVPLAMEALGRVSDGAVPGPRTRPFPLLFVLLVLGLAVGVEHDGLQVAELRLDDARYPLDDVDLRLCLLSLLLREALTLGLRLVGVVVHGLAHVVVHGGEGWRDGRVHHQGRLRL
jgi:hypothetical protein